MNDARICTKSGQKPLVELHATSGTRFEAPTTKIHQSTQDAHRERSYAGFLTFAVGTLIAERPPHRSEQAQFGHSAPTLGV
jgi:hypothetical protein